jgi:ABC-type Fe3+-hydroxamate transport system substrate-binding protein
MVIGAGSYLDELARLAGARNVFADISTPSASVSLETIAARNPDVIAVLVDDSSTQQKPSFAGRREWQAVRAVRDSRYVRLSSVLFGRPSPRAPEAVEELRRLLQPSTR